MTGFSHILKKSALKDSKSIDNNNSNKNNNDNNNDKICNRIKI